MTTEAKHTPGPWRVEEGTTLIWGDCNPDDTTTYGMGYPIAECRMTPSASWAKGPKKYEEAEANARLIAAAPDLFEVATLFASSLEYLIALDRKKGDDEGASMKGITLNVVRAALAKAEGRS